MLKLNLALAKLVMRLTKKYLFIWFCFQIFL